LKFPQYLAFSLVALAELPVATSIEERKKDQIPQHIKAFAIDILMIMSTKNTKLCCICGGFTLLVNCVTDPVFHEKSYDIISKLLIFVNDPKYRELTSTYIDFRRVFHVLTDLDNVFLEEGYKARNNLEMLSRFQSRLGLAKNAIVTLLKSWVGLIYIGNDPTAIYSLLETLKEVPKKYDS
jgi:rapamycin-insensitive companion of mTOR